MRRALLGDIATLVMVMNPRKRFTVAPVLPKLLTANSWR
jgi:hypothetical protein